MTCQDALPEDEKIQMRIRRAACYISTELSGCIASPTQVAFNGNNVWLIIISVKYIPDLRSGWCGPSHSDLARWKRRLLMK